jgi:hypothetical protein
MLFGLTRTAIPKQQGQAIDSARALFETVLRQNEAVGCLISLDRATRKNASPEKWDYCQLGIRVSHMTIRRLLGTWRGKRASAP